MSTRRQLVGGGAVAMGLLLPGHAVTAGPGDGVGGGCYGPGAQLLTRYVAEVLNGRSVETFESLLHREVEIYYPGGSQIGSDEQIGIDEVTRHRTEANAFREDNAIDDEWVIQAVLGDDHWGLAYVVYTEVIDEGADTLTLKLAYVARIVDGLIRELNVIFDN